ncbi:MAG: hypothetical protein M1823_001253 [Watsoniomyces obsoletus]|nr:MAG: hypothetical protein M1823_001253 [Watsoniomyces obsoletus]
MQIKTFSLGLFLAIITSSPALALPVPEAEPAPAPAVLEDSIMPMLTGGRRITTYTSNGATDDTAPSGSELSNVNYGATYNSASTQSGANDGSVDMQKAREYINKLLATIRQKQTGGNNGLSMGTTPSFAAGADVNLPRGNIFSFPSRTDRVSLRMFPEGTATSAIA